MGLYPLYMSHVEQVLLARVPEVHPMILTIIHRFDKKEDLKAQGRPVSHLSGQE